MADLIEEVAVSAFGIVEAKILFPANHRKAPLGAKWNSMIRVIKERTRRATINSSANLLNLHLWKLLSC